MKILPPPKGMLVHGPGPALEGYERAQRDAFMREVSQADRRAAKLYLEAEKARQHAMRLGIDERAIQGRRWKQLERHYRRQLTYEQYRWLDMKQSELFRDADRLNAATSEALECRAREDKRRLRVSSWRGRFPRQNQLTTAQIALNDAHQEMLWG